MTQTSCLQALNGSISSVSICLAYVADKLPPGHRAACFGLILASFSMGILIGPPIGGLLPPIIASYTSICCVGGALMYVIFVLDESLSERSRQEVCRCFVVLPRRVCLWCCAKHQVQVSSQTSNPVRQLYTALRMYCNTVRPESLFKTVRLSLAGSCNPAWLSC